ncbi:MAG: hypothetical protein HY454_03010 [Parcubacteria group bacterium]|nr:hypothetical protein [Parcubacteria group bacterium]
MPKSKKDNFVTYGAMEKLLADQTGVILNAIDEVVDKKLVVLELKIDQKLFALETRIDQKFDKLITTLDKFLKRLTDMEDEFEMMKHDINRIKKVVKEKLGVNLV